MSSVALAVCLANSFTSVATTANPLPASPARAASIVAFNASRLVCSAMSWITSITLPISRAASPNSAIEALLALVNCEALPATWAACSALRATSLMLELSWSTAEAMTFIFVDTCSVVAAMPVTFADISSAAALTVADWLVVSSAPPANCVAVAARSCDADDIETVSVVTWPITPWSFSTNALNHRATSPISSLPPTVSRRVRSPSPSEMSRSMDAVARRDRTIWRADSAEDHGHDA